jgi:two-component system LytT family sensor kinase
VADSVERATFHTLHTASLAAPPLRAGLTADSARKAARQLRSLLGSPALCLLDEERVLAWEGAGRRHQRDVLAEVGRGGPAARGTADVRPRVVPLRCADPQCRIRFAVIAPLWVDGARRGHLVALAEQWSDSLARAVHELARWTSGQLELAELDRARTRLVEAELRALRAQISPHFIFNSLAVIGSFIRTDPEQARELLLGFADFTRYSFRRGGEFTTLGEELGAIQHYLRLSRARFGDRLQVAWQVAPELLRVAVPFLCLQPLVENAVKHGMAADDRTTRVVISVAEDGAEALITIEDDGVGMDPAVLARVLAGQVGPDAGIGLGNVDERLRQVYGAAHRPVIETAVGEGMKITIRIPKQHPGVRVEPPSPGQCW